MSEPLSALDVDAELWSVLDLCSDEELELLYATLHGSSPFSPVRETGGQAGALLSLAQLLPEGLTQGVTPSSASAVAVMVGPQVVKSLMRESEPALLELRGRVSVMHKVETRFRFLAADPASLMQGRRPGYRETLLAIRDRCALCGALLAEEWDVAARTLQGIHGDPWGSTGIHTT